MSYVKLCTEEGEPGDEANNYVCLLNEVRKQTSQLHPGQLFSRERKKELP